MTECAVHDRGKVTHRVVYILKEMVSVDLTTEQLDNVIMGRLSGEYLDASTVKNLKSDISRAIECRGKHVVFDMSIYSFSIPILLA
ncbi:MAG TPA: hypothetical protein EYQ20_22270 [candidate division Zixibacteria bacterium]|nr:hypothetical protein [candidate division Zixibacteria bacterium]